MFGDLLWLYIHTGRHSFRLLFALLFVLAGSFLFSLYWRTFPLLYSASRCLPVLHFCLLLAFAARHLLAALRLYINCCLRPSYYLRA